MAAQLPGTFMQRMKELLGTEYEQFADSYKRTPYSGIRVNTLKISVERLRDLSPFRLEPIPWCPSGFYSEEGARPGKHPYYHAGLYYIQEPSAMAPAELLGVQPGDRVLDLCAAPGGKSTQIAAKLQGQGLLVSNDLHPERTKALAKNLELYGVRNAVVLNETPERISAAFPQFFDKILIDAPCSGEGMFRKDEDMVKQWDPETPLKYAGMQRDILRSAAAALAPGGTIVYSTCTFAPEENEGSIGEFLSAHPQFFVVKAPENESFSPGLGDLSGTVRLWPHKIKGEGHFVAILRHDGTENVTPGGEMGDRGQILKAAAKEPKSSRKDAAKPGLQRTDSGRRGGKPSGSGKTGSRADRQPYASEAALLASYRDFVHEQLGWEPAGYPVLFGEHLYLSPLPQESLNGLKAVRPGWYMGQVRNGRFVPGHPLATALRPEESVRSLSLSSAGTEAVSYLKGETLAIPRERLAVRDGSVPKGYVLVCIDGYSAGWGKWQEGMLKNEYPAGWRWT